MTGNGRTIHSWLETMTIGLAIPLSCDIHAVPRINPHRTLPSPQWCNKHPSHFLEQLIKATDFVGLDIHTRKCTHLVSVPSEQNRLAWQACLDYSKGELQTDVPRLSPHLAFSSSVPMAGDTSGTV